MAGKRMAALGVVACWAISMCGGPPATAASTRPGAGSGEFNAVRTRPFSIGSEARRLIVGFRTTADNAVTQTIHTQRRAVGIQAIQAGTTAGDVSALVARAHLRMTRSRQVTPSMHVLYLDETLYGVEIKTALENLRADPVVAFAEVDQRRYPHAVPDDPLYATPAGGGGGQWYMMTPSAGGDAAATDAVSAWAITTGSSGIVIADVDTGITFDHPDLLRAGFDTSRAGFGGRLLPGYDFVGGDPNSTGAALGTFLIANDGDGWDPDPSDPGDWISAADQANPLFLPTECERADSSWHGTRVMGILGALTDNAAGIAGMTWQPYLLPVRALGKCGGFDSDIITAMQWAAGMTVSGVADNPYPADIINLSLGGAGSCPSDYATAVKTLTAMGVLIVASAGNENGPVDAPANCPGVLGVAGLRNVGTKVGYSSLGKEVAVGAPAGNCINSPGACLKPIDTTSNTGLTVPAGSTYTTTLNPNLGTSFSAPIVSGIAALMRSVNVNLTPAQLIERIRSSAVAFPQPAGVPVCPASETDPLTGAPTGLCACPNDGSQCGSGMANALNALNAALNPIAAIVLPAAGANGVAVVLDAGGSSAACGSSIVSYAWTATGATLQSGTEMTSKATITPTGTAGLVQLTVTDSAGRINSAAVNITSSGAFAYSGTSTAGTAAGACPAAPTVAISAPSVSEAFAPATVGQNVVSTLTITLANANGFDLTQSHLTESLPANLLMAASTSATAKLAPATTCMGGASVLTTAVGTVTLSGAIIPAKGSCTITVPVQSAMAGSYINTVATNALNTGPGGGNDTAASATLTVQAPASGGGGELDWWDALFAVGVLLAGRRHVKRGPPRIGRYGGRLRS